MKPAEEISLGQETTILIKTFQPLHFPQKDLPLLAIRRQDPKNLIKKSLSYAKSLLSLGTALTKRNANSPTGTMSFEKTTQPTLNTKQKNA